MEYAEINKSKKVLSIILFIIFFLNNSQIINHTTQVNSFENEFSDCLCKLFIMRNNIKCKDTLLNNYNFFYDIEKINSDINLIIDIKDFSYIENVIFLIAIIPFIKNSSSIIYKINNKKLFLAIKNKLNLKLINKTFNITSDNPEFIKDIFINLLNYKWEFIPSQNILDITRYIINNYYAQSQLLLFEQSLNKNYEYFIHNSDYSIINSNLDKLISK